MAVDVKSQPSALIRASEAGAIPFEQLDWSGRRYRVFEELGEPVEIVFRRFRTDGTIVDEETLKHESHDGVGGFAALLESRGEPIADLPTSKGSKPSWLRRLLLLKSYLRAAHAGPCLWKEPPDLAQRGSWPAAAVALLNPARTNAIAEAARKTGASVTTVLLSHLDRHTSRRFLVPESHRKWIVPVNLRTKDQGRRYDNVAKAFILGFAGDRSPEELRATLKTLIDRDVHWAPTALDPFFMRMSHDRVKRMLSRSRPERVVFGYLSNVGSWPPGADASQDLQEGWTIIPPVTRRLMIACTTLTYRGTLSMSVKVHGALRASGESVRELLSAVMDDVAAFAGGAGAHVVFSDPKSARGKETA